MTNLKFTEMLYKQILYYRVFDIKEDAAIGIIKLSISGDGITRWIFVTENETTYMDFECLTDIAQKVKELNVEYDPKPEEIKPAIRKLDLDD